MFAKMNALGFEPGKLGWCGGRRKRLRSGWQSVDWGLTIPRNP